MYYPHNFNNVPTFRHRLISKRFISIQSFATGVTFSHLDTSLRCTKVDFTLEEKFLTPGSNQNLYRGQKWEISPRFMSFARASSFRGKNYSYI
jgi:hypothetical protein